MANPIWITPAGSIGNYPSSVAMTTTLVAEPALPAIGITYLLIDGILSPGLTLNTTTGVISGTPTSAVQTSSTITVRATDNLGNIRDRTFTINIFLRQPIWITPAGSIGNYPSGVAMTTTLVAEPASPATSLTYQIITGILSPGLTLNTTTGVISGTPTSAVQTTSTFTVRATDNLGNTRDSTFTISILGQQPNWITTAGLIGTFSSLVAMTSDALKAEPASPATSVTYQIITGSLSPGLALNKVTGIISGIPDLVTSITTSAFTVRATDNLGNIRDRSFTISILGQAIPAFTATGPNFPTNIEDSIWVEYPIPYNNPDPTNPVTVRLRQGTLPPGLEINAQGIIRGYANPPTTSTTALSVETYATSTDSVSDLITVVSTVGFALGRPVTFTSAPFGGLVENQTYYVKSINSITEFSVSLTQNGDTVNLTTDTGLMQVTLPPAPVNTPVIRTYTFILELTSPLGGDTGSYSITVANQNTPVEQGGPGKELNTRSPVILNTRPLTYLLTDQDPYYGYYILPPVDPSVPAMIGTVVSGEYFAFKIIGNDFDGNPISYTFSSLPLGLVGNTQTGWITGTPTIPLRGISHYEFSVYVYKNYNHLIRSELYNFALNVRNEITNVIIWRTNSNLGNIYNGSISDLAVAAKSDTILKYRITGGSLPPNLTLADTGDIIGRVADQPTDTLLAIGDETVFTFTVEAYSPDFATISSSKTFTLTVVQAYDRPTETLYIKAAPPLNDRQILKTLLDNDTYIPPEMIYRPNDVYFGKATSVIYEHAYGIYASDIERYLEAIKEKNYYWRYITLGEIKTAVAKNSAGEVIYEVVYSEVIDDLVNPQGVSVPIEIFWPRPIPLNLGFWYTSLVDTFTSYEIIESQEYYTALTSGTARTLYPNSLYNMRERISIEIGQDKNSNLLPLWMTSQQADGNTLGYTQAWVICYTKPGFANIIKDKINTKWPYKLNVINFQLDRFTVDKSATYNYDTLVDPHQWTSLPSATPAPDPLDSKDFYVLFPRKTILPDKAQ